MVIAHINGIRTDNRALNLRYSTHKENEADKRLHGTMLHGERHSQTKLTIEQVREIRRRWAIRGPGNRSTDMCREFGVDKTTISNIGNRKTWSYVE
jgi:hypothetical protein